jgi:alpha-acetolactate decarboxylase
MSKISFLNKHQIIFEIKMQDQTFKTPIEKLILVKEMNCIYEITQSFQSVFVSSYKKNSHKKMNNVWL